MVLDALVHTRPPAARWSSRCPSAAAAIPATSVGVLLAARRPRNPIGWLLFGILLVGASPTGEYDILDYRMHHGTLPLGWLSVMVQECWPLFLAFVAILLWVFPDGKLPAGRWRRPSVTLLVIGLVITVTASLSGVVAVAEHDVHITADGDLAHPPAGFLVPFYVATIVMSLAAWLAWIVIQIPTYRHADGERRQQLKWLYSGAAVTLVAFVFGVFVIPVAMGQAPGYGQQPRDHRAHRPGVRRVARQPGRGGAEVPAVRAGPDHQPGRLLHPDHRLAGGFYTGLVLLTTHVLPFKSAVAVAACTLITAALFNPLRRRVQRVVDRRFNRSRYNAEAVVAAFTARMRQTVDFDVVRDDLVGVVHEAFQPTQVSMWLAEAGSGHDTGSVRG